MIRTVIWQDQKRLPYLREMAAKLAGPADAFARFLVEPTLTRDSFVAEFVGEKPRPCTAAQWRYFLEEVQGIVRVALENRELKVGPENFEQLKTLARLDNWPTRVSTDPLHPHHHFCVVWLWAWYHNLGAREAFFNKCTPPPTFPPHATNNGAVAGGLVWAVQHGIVSVPTLTQEGAIRFLRTFFEWQGESYAPVYVMGVLAPHFGFTARDLCVSALEQLAPWWWDAQTELGRRGIPYMVPGRTDYGSWWEGGVKEWGREWLGKQGSPESHASQFLASDNPYERSLLWWAHYHDTEVVPEDPFGEDRKSFPRLVGVSEDPTWTPADRIAFLASHNK
jgi:hypothetical protein